MLTGYHKLMSTSQESKPVIASCEATRQSRFKILHSLDRHASLAMTSLVGFFVANTAYAVDGAAPTAASAPQGPLGSIGAFLPMILIFAVFYFLMIRPQQKQAKQRDLTLAGLKRGDRVVLTSGLIAKIFAVVDTDPVITLEFSDTLRIKALRSSVQGLFEEGTASNGGKTA